MVGTFKLNGKKVSERTFKRAVFGKDSKQAKAAAKKADARDAKRRGFSGTRERREALRAAESQKTISEKNSQGRFTSEQTVEGRVNLSQAPPQRVTRVPIVTPTKTRVEEDVIKDRLETPRQETKRKRREAADKAIAKLDAAADKAFQERIKAEPASKERAIAQAQSVGIGFVGAGIRTAQALRPANILEFGKNIITKPKETFNKIRSGLGTVGEKARADSAAFAGTVAFDIIIPGKVLKGGKQVLTRIKPGFQSVRGGDFTAKTSKGVATVEIKGGVSSTSQPLKEQVLIAGKETTGVSAADNFFKSEKAGEIVVIKKEVPVGTPELEKAFFADPQGNVRTSRLKLPEDKTFFQKAVDLVTEDLSFKDSTKRQVIIFPETPVAPFPNSLKASIEKLKQGKQISPSQAQEIIDFQTIQGGTQFKAPGGLNIESEITLSEGAGVRNLGSVGRTTIKGKEVVFFEAEVVTPSQVAAAQASGQRVNVISSGSSGLKVNNPVTPTSPALSGSSRLESPTTKSLSGLSVPPKINVSVGTIERRGSRDIDLSRGFVPRTTFQPTSTPTRTRVSAPSITPRISTPRSSGGSSRRRASSPISTPSIPRISQPTSPARTTTSRVTPPIRIFRTPVSPPPTFTSFVTPKAKGRNGRGSIFTAQVLKKGKFVSVGRSTTLKGAFGQGSQAVGSNALRSFRVLKGGTPVSLAPSGRFRRSKSKTQTLVEKSRFAINTPGEVFEIGGAAKRKKKNKNRGFFL